MHLMKCPIDGEPIILKDPTSKAPGMCSKCHGFWVPGTTLEEAVRKTHKIGQRACPCCGKVGMWIYYSGAMELDWCSGCHGFWLDSGEFDQLVTRKVIPLNAPGLSESKVSETSFNILDVFSGAVDVVHAVGGTVEAVGSVLNIFDII